MKKNWSRKRGKNFLAYGWGRYGPYAVATRRVRKGVYAKTSIGLKGILAGLKHSNIILVLLSRNLGLLRIAVVFPTKS